MSERSKLRAGPPIASSGWTLIPVEKVRSFSQTAKGGLWLFSSIEPIAVLVCGETSPKAFDLEGQETPLDDLIRKVPGLESVLNEHC